MKPSLFSEVLLADPVQRGGGDDQVEQLVDAGDLSLGERKSEHFHITDIGEAATRQCGCRPRGNDEMESPATDFRGAVNKIVAKDEDKKRVVDPLVERRRQALRNFLAERGVTPKEAADRAGFTTPNRLYNFLNGAKNGKPIIALSAQTYEALAKVFPGATIDDLTGTARRSESRLRSSSVILRYRAQAGEWLDRADVPADQQREIGLPISAANREAGAFGAILGDVGFEDAIPAGAYLAVVPLDGLESPLASGQRVLLSTARDGLFEITLRELSVRDDQAWLTARTTDPRYSAPVAMPWPYQGQPWKRSDNAFRVLGRVLWACLPQ